MNKNLKCPPCHGDCRQGRDCNAEPTIATLMLEINRLSIELEKANKTPIELSDDLIEAIALNYVGDDDELDIIGFAKAILKRASEK